MGPLHYSNGLVSRLTFSWLNPLIALNKRRPVEASDLPCFDNHEYDCENLTEKLDSEWHREKANAVRNARKPSMWKALFLMFSFQEYATLCTLMLTYSVTKTAIPYLLYCVLKKLLEPSPQTYAALLLGAILCLYAGIESTCQTYIEYRASLFAMRVRTALCGVIFKKVISLSCRDTSALASGHVTNLFATDAESFQVGLEACPSFMMAPLTFTSCAVVMVWLAGWPAMAGLSVSIAYVVAQVLCVKPFKYLRRKTLKVIDKRITLISQIIHGIRSIKMHAWETPYYQAVQRLRRLEKNVYMKKFMITFFESLYQNTLPIFSVTLCYFFTNRPLDQVVFFTLLAYFLEMRVLVAWHFTRGSQLLTDCAVSLKRIQDFLTKVDKQRDLEQSLDGKGSYSRERLLSEQNPSDYRIQISTNDHQRSSEIDRGCLPEESTSRKTESGDCILGKINLDLSGNRLALVIGPVGSGKSTLLSAICCASSSYKGKIKTNGSIAYVSQEPWIFQGTVRENIIFNSTYDAERYQKVVEACDLKEDFKAFPNGDLSEIGERGIAMSGGQRARVSLARAVYLDADIYLLDDPLSAVDFKVAKHIFEKCICGILKRKLRVLVTHHLHCKEMADEVVLLENGSMVACSDYKEFTEKYLSRMTTNTGSAKEMAFLLKDDSSVTQGEGLLSVVEERDVGAVSLRTYWEYLRAGLPVVAIALLGLAAVVTPVLEASPSWILAKWDRLTWANADHRGIIVAYISLTFAANLLRYLFSFLVYVTALQCNTRLHNKMAQSLIHAPVSFFDTNPVGRILNRFSADIVEIDNILPPYLVYTLIVCDLFVSLIIPTLASYWLLVSVILPVVMLVWYGKAFVRITREVTRLQALARSAVFSHISSTVEGLTTIRLHDARDEFIKQNHSYQDCRNRATFLVFSSMAWLKIRADLISTAVLTITSVVTILLSSSVGFIGLAITYSMMLVIDTAFVIQSAGFLQDAMTSVQRVMEYCRLSPEPAYQITKTPPCGWPRHGAVSFSYVSLRYYSDGPQVLKGVTFSIEPQQKIGIAGRTGAGKSSIVASLMRMPEASFGIHIDDVDIRGLNLQSTRQVVSVIQQNPTLLSGTIRSNLDPLDMYTDDEIWSALSDVNLSPVMDKWGYNLEHRIEEGGVNLSVGERQLFSLARALLQKNKIIIMDEVTANVDPQTDQMIQTTIRDKFKDCTVLIIAHRLSTIMDCDRIMVLHDGQVVEMDTPEALMGNADSWLAQLWQHSH
ncbi:ATP-binding cassette sub-family C member 4-like [Nematostella vectensis]|uniref:ATP-binding cassette sub-family C member 4-like n=1 Tax=Nematostella vectensis TaxID=45351 RepID=UPI0020774C5B|nr:ATP-binding cassette sub-family C member 4-like [Nematostella vectensis]